MDSKESMLEIQNLHVVYKTDLETVYAVNGLTFSLQKGQTLGLVGETGAGKTTLALTIMGLLPERTGKVTQGAVRFEGEDLIHLSEKNMRHVRGNKIAMIFQDPMTSLNPVLTVGEQIAEALIVHNEAGLTKAEIDARVDETLRMVGIPPARKNEYPHQFSGGMKQRLLLASALLGDPKLLILDEPTAGLDPKERVRLRELLADMAKDRIILVATHVVSDVETVATKVILLRAGKIVDAAPVPELIAKYAPGQGLEDVYLNVFGEGDGK